MHIDLPEKRYYGIGEVARAFDVNTSLIRFWEKEFDVLQPKKNAKGNRKFTPRDIKKLFTENQAFLQDNKSIQITGGEPTLHPQLPEIIKIIHETLPDCTFWIPTNGQNPEEIRETTETILEKLNGKNLGVTISIDGPP